MRSVFVRCATAAAVLCSISSLAQTAPATAPASPAQNTVRPAPPLRLQSLTPDTKVDPFPPNDPKNFTAATPTMATVDGFLRALWGYDANRLWRVGAIQATAAVGISKVVVFVSERVPGAKVQTAVFYTTPDGTHAIADQSGVIPFGVKPYAELRASLIAHADGPARGAAAKDLLLVEFADLQCSRCKEAQKTMDQLVQDFPKARVVYQDAPRTGPASVAFQAAEYGECVARKSPETFLLYARAMYDAQAALTPETSVATLNSAVVKAGLDPVAIAACAATDATKDRVTASSKLAADAGVEQSPMLSVNGRLLPLTGVPYETLKSIIIYQAEQDGITGVAPPLTGLKIH